MIAWEAACSSRRNGEAAYDMIVRPLRKPFFRFKNTKHVGRLALKLMARLLVFAESPNPGNIEGTLQGLARCSVRLGNRTQGGTPGEPGSLL